jgi:Asp-tRNA(Asn)/Glu-tRNA(Gln) amidotransferase A subunit family amidase
LSASFGSASWPARRPPTARSCHPALSGPGLIFGKTNAPKLALKGVTDTLAFGRCSTRWL